MYAQINTDKNAREYAFTKKASTTICSHLSYT